MTSWAPAVWAVVWVIGCAEGSPVPAEITEGIEGAAGEPGVLSLGPSSAADAGGTPLDAGSEPVVPAGDPCMQGVVETCTCVDLGTEGERRCVFDAASPLDGFFSECERCPEPPPEREPEPEPDAGASTGGGAGGTNAAAATPATGGSGAPPPPPSGTGCAANPGMCSALLQCCRQDGQCGLGLPGVLCL